MFLPGSIVASSGVPRALVNDPPSFAYCGTRRGSVAPSIETTRPREIAMTRRNSRRQLLLAGAAAGAVVGAPWISRAQALKSEYKVSVVGNRPIALSEGAFQWAELVTQRTQGRINMKVYPGSQLVGG
ncbi:MAG: hypothetical protein ACK51F_01795, partial [Rhodospirillales bacterium]